MKPILWILGLLLGLGVAYYALMTIASETAEVVVVHAAGADGGQQSTRLWVVDYQGQPWLRAGHEQSGWLDALLAAPSITVERGGGVKGYRAVPALDARDAVNALMQEKYGWRETLISTLVGGREQSVPIRLEPVATPP